MKLEKTRVLVVGVGGLGCPCLMALASSGVGCIGIVDGDRISMSNISRQTLFDVNDIGKAKSTVAVQSLKKRNPYITYDEYSFFIDEENVLAVLAGYDLIVDATDNFHTRYLINDACTYLHKTLIYGSVFRTEGNISVFNHQNSASLRSLFPEPEFLNNVFACADSGAYTVTTTLTGTYMANEVLKVILGQPDILIEKLLTIDALSFKSKILKYKYDFKTERDAKARFLAMCKPIELALDEFLANSKQQYVQIIDVRTATEHAAFNIGGLHVPIEEFHKFSLSIKDKNQYFYLYCETGARSLQAVKFLIENGVKNSFSLKNGIKSIMKRLYII